MILYNSLTHRKEPFVPRFGNKVSMYTCGPTVYHFAQLAHLYYGGHARKGAAL